MVDYKFYLNKDYFKIGNFGEKRVQYVNIALAGNIILNSYYLYFNILILFLLYYVHFYELSLSRRLRKLH